jgi:hypothetical protein
LESYLGASDREKQQYYEVIAGAAAACHPSVCDPTLEDEKVAQASAEAAIKIVKFRVQQVGDADDRLAQMITDAYATVAIAYRRAAAVYIVDKDMQQLGTAAVHLVTIANSYVAARSGELAR